MDYRHYKTLKVKKEDRVAVLTLSRPEVLNAFNATMHQEIMRIWQDLQGDPEVYAVVLTGEGRGFSSGGDLDWLALHEADFSNAQATFYEAMEIIERLLRMDKPLVGAVNGIAVGLGATLVFYCDIVIASERARIGDTHVNAGLVAGDGAVAVLPFLVGMRRAKEMMLLGKILTAEQASSFGLFNEVVPHEQLLPRAKEVARELAAAAPWAVRWTKASLNQLLKLFTTVSFNNAMALETLTMFTEDFGKALRGLRERTDVQFEDR